MEDDLSIWVRDYKEQDLYHKTGLKQTSMLSSLGLIENDFDPRKKPLLTPLRKKGTAWTALLTVLVEARLDSPIYASDLTRLLALIYDLDYSGGSNISCKVFVLNFSIVCYSLRHMLTNSSC